MVDTQSDDIRRLTGLLVTDLAWAPDALELAFIGNGISVYSVASDEIRPLGDPSGLELDERGQLAGAARLDWSPDGRTIAFTGPSPGTSDGAQVRSGSWTPTAPMSASSSPRSAPTTASDRCGHPTATASPTSGSATSTCSVGPCREDHEVVLVTVNDDEGEPAGTQEVIPAPQTNGPDGPIWWYPFSVTWSPDGTALLYLAWNYSPDGLDLSRTDSLPCRSTVRHPPWSCPEISGSDCLARGWARHAPYPNVRRSAPAPSGRREDRGISSTGHEPDNSSGR